MIKKFTSIIAIIFASIYFTSAQTVLHPVNIPVVGDHWPNKTITDTTIQPGPGGMGQVWNFTNYFVNPTVISETFVAPTGTGDDTLFPTANLKVNSLFGGNDYYLKSANALQFLGTKSTTNEVIITSLQNTLTVPLAYGDSVSNQVVTGTGIFGYTLSGTISAKADGAGDLSLYTGSFTNTLRVVTDVNIIAGAGTGNDTYISIKKYSWYASTYRAPVFQIAILDINGNLGSVHQKVITVSTLTTDVPTISGNEIDFNIHPNPTHESVFVTINKIKPGENSLALFDMTGKKLKEELISASQTMDEFIFDTSDLAKGIYILTLKNDEKFLNKKLVIE